MQLSVKLSVLSFLISFHCFAQQPESKTERETEIDFLISYYGQQGDNSAVTGGQGTEELHDYAEIIIVNVPIKENKSLRIENGISYFTSASNDQINPTTISSASYADLPIYIDVTYSTEDTARRKSYGINSRVLFEMYFGSISLGGFYSKMSKDQNRELKLTANFFMDKWALYYPIRKLYPYELKRTGLDYVTTDKRYSSNFDLIFSQVLNTSQTCMVTLISLALPIRFAVLLICSKWVLIQTNMTAVTLRRHMLTRTATG
jgi:hypothetical protein